MAATSVELTTTAKMTAAATHTRTAKVRPAAVESPTAAEMRTTAASAAHMNATAAVSSASTAARACIRRNGQSCQEGHCYDGDFEKVSHGFAPRIGPMMCKHSMFDGLNGSA
jgi:hypothetical protein